MEMIKKEIQNPADTMLKKLPRELKEDSWGTPYVLEYSNGTPVRIRSLGSDRVVGGTGDASDLVLEITAP
jgi:hypothetical protein